MSSRGSYSRGKKAQIISYMWERKANIPRVQANVRFITNFPGNEGKRKNSEAYNRLI